MAKKNTCVPTINFLLPFFDKHHQSDSCLVLLKNFKFSTPTYLTFFKNVKGCSRIKCVVGFLINKILWVVGDIKIKISCLVGKLKPTQLICVVLPQF